MSGVKVQQSVRKEQLGTQASGGDVRATGARAASEGKPAGLPRKESRSAAP